MADIDVSDPTLISLFLGSIIVNVYVMALAFGLASAIAFVLTDTGLGQVFNPVVGTLLAVGSLLAVLRSVLLDMVAGE